MRNTARQSRENRTITVDFRSEATYFQLLGDGKAFLECVLAFVLSLGFQLKHKATCRGGGCLTRHSHYVRVRLGGITIWRLQCTTCRAVFTILPHFILRYRQMRPEVARDALLATHGGLSLELCAVIHHVAPMALYRLVCALGHQSLVAVLTRCGLPLPVYVLADEKHSTCLADKVYLPTIVRGRVIWHLGYTEEASAAALTQSYEQHLDSVRQKDALRGVESTEISVCPGNYFASYFEASARDLPTLNASVLGPEVQHEVRLAIAIHILTMPAAVRFPGAVGAKGDAEGIHLHGIEGGRRQDSHRDDPQVPGAVISR